MFSYSFQPEQYQEDEYVGKIVKHQQEIDTYIKETAPEWPIERLNKVDLAILRVGVFELLIDKKIPPKVVIDEAVEMGKEYGSESTAKFVNGVLGKLMDIRNQEAEKKEK